MPDNLRSAVSKAHRYEPDINPSYRDLAEHYGVAVVPARARKPRDKAKAEVGVQVVERWILAALRNRQFFSLDELNSAIALLLKRLNRRPFRKLPGSRYSAFEALDRPALRHCRSSPTCMPSGRRRGWGLAPFTVEQRRDMLERLNRRPLRPALNPRDQPNARGQLARIDR